MEVQELRIFLTIVDQGGFKNAAEFLGLTQPAISQSLANLERKLNAKLIDRKNPISPTLIGLELLKHARFMLDSENQFTQQLKDMKQGHLLNLSIAVDHLAANYDMPKLIPLFHQKLPKASLKVMRMPPREMIEGVQNEQYLMGMGPFQKEMQHLHRIRMQDKYSYLITSKNHQHLSLYYSDPLAFLKKMTLLVSYLDDADKRPSKIKIRDYFSEIWQINDINLQLELIHQGIGATFVSKKYLEAHPLKNEFIILDKLPFGQITKQYGIYILRKNINHTAIREFLSLVEENTDQ